MKRKRKCKYFVPFSILREKDYEYLLWICSIVICGLLGLIFDFFREVIKTNQIWDSFIITLKNAADNGSFYLVAIVLVASTFSSIFSKFQNYQKAFGYAHSGFIIFKYVMLTILLAVLNVSSTSTDDSHTCLYYVIEGIFFILAIVVSSRLYAISLLDEKSAETLFAEEIKNQSKEDYSAALQQTTTTNGAKL